MLLITISKETTIAVIEEENIVKATKALCKAQDKASIKIGLKFCYTIAKHIHKNAVRILESLTEQDLGMSLNCLTRRTILVI